MPSDPPHTPPSPSHSTVGVSDHPSKPVSPRPTHSLPTPAHSINGSMSSIPDLALESSQGDENLNKRKRDVEDGGDRDQKKVHLEDSRLSIEDLHVDVGKKYLLCRTPHVRKGPDTTTDLFELYGFTDLAASVARATAENPEGKRIRKTYKGVFKHLSGNFDVDKREKFTPGTLSEMVTIPDFEWDAHMVRGKSITDGFSAASLSAMSQAFTMSRGIIPKKAWNKAVLGDVVATAAGAKSVIRPGVKAPAAATTSTPVATARAPSAPASHVPQSSSNELQRPKRAIKRRRIGGEEYQGWGNGMADDESQDAGYSDGDGEDDDGGRKRLKKSSAVHGFGPPRQTNSYGPGMIGA